MKDKTLIRKHVFNLRLNDNEMEMIKKLSEKLGSTPTNTVRNCITYYYRYFINK